MKFEGTPEALRTRSKQVFVLGVEQPESATGLLHRVGRKVTREGGLLLVEPAEDDPVRAAAQINTLLVRQGIAVSQLRIRGATLEEAFLELTHPSSQAEAVDGTEARP